MNPIQSMDGQPSGGLFKLEAIEKSSSSSEEEFVLAGDEGASMELEASEDDTQKSTTERKRKLEEESDDEDDEDDYYDSSDDYESVYQEESDEFEEETKAADNSPLDEDEDDSEVEDEDLMSVMPDSEFSPTKKITLLPKIRRYIKSVRDSKGYELKSFPGVIWGITSVIPRKSLIRHRDRYPEGYNRVMYLSMLALKQYNDKESTTFVVENVIDVNVIMSMWKSYLLTFTATEGERTETFQAYVSCNCILGTIEVESCDIKPGSVPTRNTTRQGFECYFAEDEKTDPLTAISRLSGLSDDKLLVKINKEDLPAKKKNILLKKVRKYFKSVLDSKVKFISLCYLLSKIVRTWPKLSLLCTALCNYQKGFECSYYPGPILGVTYLKPREKIVNVKNNHGECYEHLVRMGMLGLDYFFKQQGKPEHDYKVVSLENATMWKESSCSYFYYVTFGATKWDYDEDGYRNLNSTEYFQVKVQDTQRDILVLLVNKLED